LERSQLEFTLNVSVAGAGTLEKALEMLCGEEIIADYFVPERTERTMVRHSVDSGPLPDILFFQLSRFRFDQGKDIRAKIGDRFEFPLSLELDGSYRLTGVILHRGSAEFGHFRTIGRVGDWQIFGDTDVGHYQIARLPVDAFGEDNNATGEGAYLLCYVKGEVPRSELLPEALQIARDASHRLPRTVVASSTAFYDVVLSVNDPGFAWLSFFNIVLHMSDHARCERMREHLTQSMLAGSEAEEVAQMASRVINDGIMLYLRCPSFTILTSWTTFLKSLVRSAPALMANAVTLFVCARNLSNIAAARRCQTDCRHCGEFHCPGRHTDCLRTGRQMGYRSDQVPVQMVYDAHTNQRTRLQLDLWAADEVLTSPDTDVRCGPACAVGVDHTVGRSHRGVHEINPGNW
jgi:hypothetical protein